MRHEIQSVTRRTSPPHRDRIIWHRLMAPREGTHETETTSTVTTAPPAKKSSGGLGGKVLAELQGIAKDLGIDGTSMRKGALIDAIKQARGDAPAAAKVQSDAPAAAKVQSDAPAAAKVQSDAPAAAKVQSEKPARAVKAEKVEKPAKVEKTDETE